VDVAYILKHPEHISKTLSRRLAKMQEAFATVAKDFVREQQQEQLGDEGTPEGDEEEEQQLDQ
jgi:hypothetical protein